MYHIFLIILYFVCTVTMYIINTKQPWPLFYDNKQYKQNYVPDKLVHQ